MSNREHEFEMQKLRPLVGGVITQVIEAEGTERDPSSFGFAVEVPMQVLVRKVKVNRIKRFHVWIDCDSEGNGPGSVKVEEQS